MSATAAPTERQLRYLRSLAHRSATTFAIPATRREASREIDRLRGLQRAPQEPRGEEAFAYATAVQEDELSGFGAARRWRSQTLTAPAPGLTPPRVLARYALSSGERLIECARSAEGLTLRDVPAGGEGSGYAIETLSAEASACELRALLADYLARAGELDAVPMSQRALGLMLGGDGRHA